MCEELKRQSEAIRRIRQELMGMSLTKFARALGRSRSQASRWEHPHDPQRMGDETRVRLARLIAPKFTDLGQMERYLAGVGWRLADEERQEAELHLQWDDSMGLMPYVDVSEFVGREEELARLKGFLLARGATAPLILVVRGMPGAGKTTLMARLWAEVEVRERFSDGIIWVQMEPGLLDEQVEDWQGSAFRSLVEQIFPDQTLEARWYSWRGDSRRKVRRALHNKHSLLVLDGAEDRIDLDQWMMVDPIVGRLLVTTRRTDLDSRMRESRMQDVTLEEMGFEQSRRLLTRHVRVMDIEEADLIWILKTLGGLPLALDIVNRVAQEEGFGQLLAELREHPIPALEMSEPVRKEESLRWAFDLSYRRLDLDAKAVFRSLSVSPQPFEAESVACVLGWSSENVRRAFRTLVRVGLVKREQTDRYRTHRLLHEYAITLAEECDARYLRVWRERFGEYYLNVTQGVFAMWQQGEEAEASKMWPRQIRHIERGYEYAADQGRGDRVLEYLRCTAFYLGLSGREATVRHWLDRFGSLSWGQVQGASGNMYLGEAFLLLDEAGQSVSLLRMARSVWSEVGEDRLWLHTTILLAQALMVAGQREAALALSYGEDYARIVESLPAGDPLRAEVWTFSGDARRAMGRYPDAQYCYLKAMESMGHERDKKNLWARSRLLLALGETRLALEDSTGALENLEDGMRLAKVGGYEHIWHVLALQAAMALAQLGRTERAMERLTLIRQEVGDDPRFVPLLLVAEAEVCWSAGDWDRAEQACWAAVEECAGTMMELDVWMLLGRYLKERGEMERAAEVWRQMRERGMQTGHWHQYLSATLECGRYLLETGRPDEARPLLMEVAERGVEEMSYRLAAGALELLGMPEEAEALRQRSLIEEEMLLLPVVAASIGWTTQTVLGVKQGGWWQTMVIPGFGGGS